VKASWPIDARRTPQKVCWKVGEDSGRSLDQMRGRMRRLLRVW
jgi:hypothetical protein